MSLYRDIYQELGKWLDAKTMLSMRITCKMLKDLYKLETIRQLQMEIRMKNGYKIGESIICFGCDNITLMKTQCIGFEFRECTKCERMYFLSYHYNKNEMKKHMCQYIGHAGFLEGKRKIRYSRKEYISKEVMDKHQGNLEELYQGFEIEESMAQIYTKHRKGLIYNITDDKLLHCELEMGTNVPNWRNKDGIVIC